MTTTNEKQGIVEFTGATLPRLLERHIRNREEGIMEFCTPQL